MISEKFNPNTHGLVIIGSSTGGIEALTTVLNRIRLDAAVIIVQHMPIYINERVRKRIEGTSGMPCRVPESGESIQPRSVYIAPSERHLVVRASNYIDLKDTEKVQFVRPAVDVTMASLKPQPARKYTGVILTGMGRDGTAGIQHMKSIGALTIAQDPESCSAAGMPSSAIQSGAIDLVLDPQRIRLRLMAEYGTY